ncbi:SdpI family protein [soil metagenome]
MNNRIFYPLLAIVLVAPFILIGYFWSAIPEIIPIHYNIHNEPNDWAPKSWGMFLIPVISLVVTLVLLAVPKLDPKGNIDKFIGVYRGIVIATATFMTALTCMEVLRHVGYPVPDNSIQLGVVVLFAFIGNVMLKLKPSFFVGIRTPWTLSNDEVWRRTHRLGGYLWVFASLLMIPVVLLTPVEIYPYIFLGYVAIISIIPIAYSAILYFRLKGKQN